MRDPMICRTKTLWRIGLAVLVLSIIPASLWSQSVLSSQHADSATNAPFAGYDDSLTKAADTLLASATQTTTSATRNEKVNETLTSSLAIHDDQQSRRRSGSVLGIAAARLDLLRPSLDPILRSHGVPLDLAAVILVESGGRSDALSPKGARGLWQLMPDTARRYGLRVDAIQDDRLDLFRATDAAARYLHDLYARFGDWKLALAAYNTGEANVESAILRAHTQDFDQLSSMRMLPLETINYVPRVFASIRPSRQPSLLMESHEKIGSIKVFASSNR